MFDQLINRREALQLIGGGITALGTMSPRTQPAPLELHEWITEDDDFWTDRPQLVHGPLSVRDRASVICCDRHRLLQMPLAVYESEHESASMPAPQSLLASLAARPHLSDQDVAATIKFQRSEWPDRWQPWPYQDYRMTRICRERHERVPFAAPCPRCRECEWACDAAVGCRDTGAAHYRLSRYTLGSGHALFQPVGDYLIPAETDILVRRLRRSRPGHDLQCQLLTQLPCCRRWPVIAFRIADLRGLITVAGQDEDPLRIGETSRPRPGHAAEIAAALQQLDQVWSVT